MSDDMRDDERFIEFLWMHDRLAERHEATFQAACDAAENASKDGTRLLAAHQKALDADPEVVAFRARYPATDSVWRRFDEEQQTKSEAIRRQVRKLERHASILRPYG
jgi:hypothetical protein